MYPCSSRDQMLMVVVRRRGGRRRQSFWKNVRIQRSLFEGLAPAQRMPRLHNWEKESKKLRICIKDSSCMTAWVDGTSHARLISEGKI